MKKLLLLIIVMCCLVTGCGKNTQKYVSSSIIKKFEKSSGYKLSGNLEINNNDEVYNYRITSAFDKKNGFYKIVLENKSNDFKQYIVKNKEGVFLLTPSLNKSFKFNSDWPYKNSQIYLYDTIINDIKNDRKLKYEYKDNKYIYNVKARYSNNSDLVKQKIIFDKNYSLKLVSVYDTNDNLCMKLTIDKLKISPSFDKDYFKIDDNSKKEKKKTKETIGIDDVIYPLFLPSGTKLVEEKKIDKDNGQRVIMTYDGEKSFVLVEETLDVFNDLTIIPSSGEPFQLMDTIGVMTNNSLSWISGDMEYYLISDVMDKNELVEIAQSIVGVISTK